MPCQRDLSGPEEVAGGAWGWKGWKGLACCRIFLTGNRSKAAMRPTYSARDAVRDAVCDAVRTLLGDGHDLQLALVLPPWLLLEYLSLCPEAGARWTALVSQIWSVRGRAKGTVGSRVCSTSSEERSFYPPRELRPTGGRRQELWGQHHLGGQPEGPDANDI